MYEKTAFKCEKNDKCYETNAPAAQVALNPRWDRKKEVFVWTPELVATVDATLAGLYAQVEVGMVGEEDAVALQELETVQKGLCCVLGG